MAKTTWVDLLKITSMRKEENNQEIIKPENFEETLVWYTLTGIYGLYFLGAQPIFVPIVTWILAFYLVAKLWQPQINLPEEERIKIPLIAWIWVVGMLTIFVALIVSHVTLDAGIGRLIKSIMRWGRGWALWALLPLIGSCLNIRPKLLYRAVCIVCLQSLIFMLVAYLAYLINFPGHLFISPLAKIGGGGPGLYSFDLYMTEGGNRPRLVLFAPWAPNLALVALIFLFISRQESNRNWYLIGMVGSVLMTFSTISRLAILCLPAIPFLTWILTNLSRPALHYITGSIGFLIGISSHALIEFAEAAVDKFHSMRPGSSSLRILLIRLSLDAWWKEARVWGHGFTKEQGPRLTFSYPIGTSGCGTWVNVLYTNGLVGFIGLIVPFICTFFVLFHKAQKSTIAKMGLSVFLVFAIFSGTEELDLLAYIYWPGLLALGMAMREEIASA